MIRFEEAINKLFPATEWVCYGGSLEGLTFMDETIQKPTQAQIDKALKELESEQFVAIEESGSQKAALLAKLGITEDEAKLLLS